MAVSRELSVRSNSDKEIKSSNGVHIGERVESCQICRPSVRFEVPPKCLFGVVQI